MERKSGDLASFIEKKKPFIFHTERDIKENKQVEVLYIEGETNFLK